MYDLTITYADVEVTETIPKVAYDIDASMLKIRVNVTTTIYIPMARIRKIEVLG